MIEPYRDVIWPSSAGFILPFDKIAIENTNHLIKTEFQRNNE